MTGVDSGIASGLFGDPKSMVGDGRRRSGYQRRPTDDDLRLNPTDRPKALVGVGRSTGHTALFYQQEDGYFTTSYSCCRDARDAHLPQELEL